MAGKDAREAIKNELPKVSGLMSLHIFQVMTSHREITLLRFSFPASPMGLGPCLSPQKTFNKWIWNKQLSQNLRMIKKFEKNTDPREKGIN